jgi:hypothetical protein
MYMGGIWRAITCFSNTVDADFRQVPNNSELSINPSESWVEILVGVQRMDKRDGPVMKFRDLIHMSP